MTTDKQRHTMGVVMDLLVEHSSKVHYRQKRPMVTAGIHTVAQLKSHLQSAGGLEMDCSESVTLICHIAGLRDPSGAHYDGEGNTGTLLAYLDKRSKPGRPGSMAVFLRYKFDRYGEHVIMRRDAEHWFSHGCEADPRYFTWAGIKAGFPGKPVQFLGIGKLGY